ncbi:hypothetical protein AAGS61_11930 [Lysinibacillus sp. KU-BSD001]|uniref:hypothetical protein n=1 Tax=Lysinibacillus sp. KU-BSD001 TaxID=3141328 RepID=UPI0036EB9D30
MSYTISLILFAIIAGIVAVIFKIPFWILVVTIISISLLRAGYVMYILYRSQNVQKIERFLQSSIKNPLYNYTLSLKESSPAIQKQAIDHILATYKSPIMQGTYRANRAMMDHNYSAAKDFAAQIPNDMMRNYSLALIDATQGNAKAENYILAKPWMTSLIAAVLQYKKGQMDEYEQYKIQALQYSRGIQYFTNYYYFERIHENVKTSKANKKIKKSS